MFPCLQNVAAKHPNMMKTIMAGQQQRMMAPHMMGPNPKRPKLNNQPLPGPPMGHLGGPRGPPPGSMGPGPRGPPMMGNRPMGPVGQMGPAGMMGPNGQFGPGRPGPGPGGPCDMNMGVMGPSGPMRPTGPASELSSPGPHVPSSLSDSPLTSGPSSLPSCSLGSPMTTSMTNTTTTTSNDGAGLGPLPDPDTPDPSRPEGPSSPLLGNINDISGS